MVSLNNLELSEKYSFVNQEAIAAFSFARSAVSMASLLN